MTALALSDWFDYSDLAPEPESAALWWLGQAGFLIEFAGQRIVIDPYLSDSLAEKYRGKAFPHVRMMPVPVHPEVLTGINWVLITHGHTDHMDPGTLGPLLAANPQARVLVPRAEHQRAIERGVPQDRLTLIDAEERISLGPIRVTATHAAHEEITKDPAGQSLFLGYVLSANGVTIWHSGDTIPFPGLVERLAPHNVDLALLPVNGRDGIRAGNGVPGNLTLSEALDLSEAIGARAMIGHHLDMFEFNTLNRAQGSAEIADMAPEFSAHLAEPNIRYAITEAREARRMRRVLMVCRGNICRSPMAEAALRSHFGDIDIEIDSAAIEDWNVGKGPDARAIDVCSEQGLDIAMQRARQVTAEDFDNFDLILGMDNDNLERIKSLRPQGSSARVGLLGNLLIPGIKTEISDPYYGKASDFQSCLKQIQHASAILARKLIPQR